MTILATATATEPNSPSTPGGVNCHSQNVARGTGLGVPLGLALLSAALLAYRVWNLRQRRNQPTDVAHQQSKKARPAELGGHVVLELPGSGNSDSN
jgi:hypothetical protein